MGIASWLGYFAAIVIVCSMVAVSFGSYATSLFIGDDAAAGWDNVFTTLVVLAMAAINIVGSRVVDRAQSLIVVVLLAVFAVFIAVTLVDIDLDLLAFSGYPSYSDIIASVALTFFAYLGFSVITFAAGDLRDPARELPRAMYLALGVTSLLYVLISLGVFGTLTVDEVIGYGETAIAEAARPALGDAGFTMMAIAALLATASSVNATLYASGGLTRMLAQVGQFPTFFGPGSRLGPHSGLLITSAIVLVVSNLVDLSAIASVGSACSLVIFLLVGVAGYRRRADTGSQAVIVLAAIAVTAIVLAFFAVDTVRNAPETFAAIVAIALLAVVLDLVWKRMRGGAGRTRRASPKRLRLPCGSSMAGSLGTDPPVVAVEARFGGAARSGRHRAPPPLCTGADITLATRRQSSRNGFLRSQSLGLAGAQISATPTMVEVSLGSLPHQRSYSLRVRPTAVDLDAIARLDELVQDVLDTRLDSEAALASLTEIQATPLDRPWPVLLAAYAIAGAALTPVLGGGWREAATATLVGLVVGLIALPTRHSARTEPMIAPIAGVAASFCAAALSRIGLDASPDIVTLAALVTFLPGMRLTIGMRELATEHLQSGVANTASALVQLFGLVFGVGIGRSVANSWFGPVQSGRPSRCSRASSSPRPLQPASSSP